ncbi:MAG: hydantoinase B/oxoprolinase family protein, partial [Hyphomicrobiales bacterium]|nr:hydantoinase B/oxoprolinase family protein [Hyphomicrobiales bacterium]
EAELTVIMERIKCSPWGVDGGGAGKTGKVEVHRASGGEPETYYKGTTRLHPGDEVYLFTGGGGGYGDPSGRSRLQIERDLELGLISREHARAEYGYQT